IIIDGRVFGLTTWTGFPGSQTKATVTLATGVLNATKYASTAPANMVGAFYRLHVNNSITQPAVSCKQISGSAQIGCFVQANPCRLGFGDSVAADGLNSCALKENGIDPVDPCIRNTIIPGSAASSYPVTYKFYLNSIQGFESIGTTPSGPGSNTGDPFASDQN